MATMSRFCKAYPLERLRRYSGWTESAAGAPQEGRVSDGAETESPRELKDDSYVYLHDDYVVTDGIARDENVVFDNVTPEWVEFCTKELRFEDAMAESH